MPTTSGTSPSTPRQTEPRFIHGRTWKVEKDDVFGPLRSVLPVLLDPAGHNVPDGLKQEADIQVVQHWTKVLNIL